MIKKFPEDVAHITINSDVTPVEYIDGVNAYVGHHRWRDGDKTQGILVVNGREIELIPWLHRTPAQILKYLEKQRQLDEPDCGGRVLSTIDQLESLSDDRY